MTIHIYLRASTKDQNSSRAQTVLNDFANTQYPNHHIITYFENFTGTKIERPELDKLLSHANKGDTLLIESVDRLTRLTSTDFLKLKLKISEIGLQLVILDLPTTHNKTNDTFQQAINALLIDLLASMARLDQEKRIERIKQGLEKSGYKPKGKSINQKLHNKVSSLLNENPNLKADDIAKLAGCGVATVYRIKQVTQ